MSLRLLRPLGKYSSILGFLLLTACAIEPEVERAPKPDRLLSEKEMTDASVAVHLAVARASFDGNPRLDLKFKERQYRLRALERSGIDSATFAANLDYYAEDPEKMQAISQAVIDSLTTLKDSADRIEAQDRAEQQKRRQRERQMTSKQIDSLKAKQKLIKLDTVERNAPAQRISAPKRR